MRGTLRTDPYTPHSYSLPRKKRELDIDAVRARFEKQTDARFATVPVSAIQNEQILVACGPDTVVQDQIRDFPVFAVSNRIGIHVDVREQALVEVQAVHKSTDEQPS
jgi:hypothetical protein